MNRKVLIIDNDADSASSISNILEDEGYLVFTASSGTAAVTMSKKVSPILIFLNLATPETNGLEICKALQSATQGKSTPIVLLTLRDGKFDPRYKTLYGIVGFLKKPVTSEGVISSINAITSPGAEAPGVDTSADSAVDDALDFGGFDDMPEQPAEDPGISFDDMPEQPADEPVMSFDDIPEQPAKDPGMSFDDIPIQPTDEATDSGWSLSKDSPKADSDSSGVSSPDSFDSTNNMLADSAGSEEESAGLSSSDAPSSEDEFAGIKDPELEEMLREAGEGPSSSSQPGPSQKAPAAADDAFSPASATSPLAGAPPAARSYSPTRIRTRPKHWWKILIPVLSLILIGAAGFGVYAYFFAEKKPPPPPQKVRARPSKRTPAASKKLPVAKAAPKAAPKGTIAKAAPKAAPGKKSPPGPIAKAAPKTAPKGSIAKAAPKPPAKAASPPSSAKKSPVKTSAAPKTTAKKASATRKKPLYYIQFGAFSNKANAEDFSRIISKKGYDAFVHESVKAGRKIYRVLAGKFDSRKEARDLAKFIKKQKKIDTAVFKDTKG